MISRERQSAALQWLSQCSMSALKGLDEQTPAMDRPAAIWICRDDFPHVLDACDALRTFMAADERRRKQAKAAASKGGKVSSEAKTRAARANAKKPRPRKAKPAE